MKNGRWTVRGVVGTAALAVLAGAFAWRCGDDDSSSLPCTQLLCEGGSEICCIPAAPGTWDPVAMACNCVPPVADADADGDDVPGPDADGDDVPETLDDGTAEEGADPCWEYPCGSTGTRLGNVFPDVAYTAVNAAADEYLGEDGLFGMRDLYQHNEAHGGTLKAVMFFVTATWCPYCAEEADRLEELYQALRDQGVLLVGLVAQDDGGNPPSALEGRTYANRHGWTFPTVIADADIPANYWPPDDVASGEIGFPLHLFFDVREMRLYGRFAGAVENKMPRYALEEIAAEPHWRSPGVREFDFDCAPGTGTETEPNDGEAGYEDGTGFAAAPYTLTGVFCPPTVGDGLVLDVDAVNLGRLSAGTVIDVSMTTAGTSTYPFFELIPASSAGGYPTMGPSAMGTTEARRQWVILAADQYFVGGLDGRQMSSFYYGEGATVPERDQCCEGGPGYDYSMTVQSHTLAPTDGAVTVGTPVSGAFADGSLDVYSLEVVAGEARTVRMTAADTDRLDPFLVIYDPATSSVVGWNDDEASGNLNSMVRFTPAAAGTLYVVAGYYAVSFRSPPAYTITVD